MADTGNPLKRVRDPQRALARFRFQVSAANSFAARGDGRV